MLTMCQGAKAAPKLYPFVKKVALPSFTACWNAPSAFLVDSGQRSRLVVSEFIPHDCEYHLSESGNGVDYLNDDMLFSRCSETWKMSSDHRAIVYSDTAAGTVQYVLTREASRVWLACNGIKSITSVVADCGEDDHVKKYIVALLEEGLLLCHPENPFFS